MKFMNTQEIINFTAENYMNDNGSPELNYQDYLKIYRSWEVYSPSLDKIRNRLPLKDSVVKLVYKKIYSKMPFDREYILKNMNTRINTLIIYYIHQLMQSG